MNSTPPAERVDVLRRIASVITVPLGALASLSTIAIMIAITVDVVVRNLGGRSVPGLLEMSESALVATVFLGLAYAGATNAHVAVDLLTAAIRPAIARILIGISWVIGVAVSTWFLIATFQRAAQSTASNELRQGLVDWPVWPARWLIVIGFAAFLLVAVINVVLILRGQPLLGEDRLDPDLAAAREARIASPTADAAAPAPADTPADTSAGSGDPPSTHHRPEEGRH
ncbi:TRAP transporter small permease [Microbacterium sp. A93]|uniref:TRAP transporter small permease n=1 Tax=Microbacterium sp. A93 TaxID=3450716 RepID=UPI003F42CF06